MLALRQRCRKRRGRRLVCMSLHRRWKCLPAARSCHAANSIMCGITGYVSTDRRAWESLPSMTDALVHRGPDSGGHYRDGAVGLGFRRLSVIDIEGSNQPLISPAQNIAVIFNGEIYNYRALRRGVAGARHVFSKNGGGGGLGFGLG